jgi:hypothetical protein
MEGPAVRAPTHHGFGGRVIKGIIDLLKGKANFGWRSEGLVCEMSIQA